MSVQRITDRVGFETRDPWLLGLACLSGLVALLVVSPLGWIVWQALSVEPGRALELLVSSQTAWVTLNSLGLMAIVTAASIALGVPLALLTTRTDLPFARFWTVVAALPLVIPSYIGAMAFLGMFGPGGEIGSILGVSIPQIDGLTGAALIITLYTYPYVFLTARASILSMDDTLVDAARTLNAGWLETFRRVTLPQIRPGIAAGALLAGLYAVSDFGTPAFMGADVFTSTIFWEWEGFAMEYAALLALQLIAIVAIVLVIEAGIGRDEDATTGRQRGSRMQLGHWKWPAMGFIGTLGFLTLVVPLLIFGRWLLRSEGQRHSVLTFQWEFALNSVYLATLAAIVACAFALPVAYYAARSSSTIGRVFERATYVGFAVPGIVIGLALVFLGTRTVPGLYREGVVLLVFAYVVRFLPQAVGATRAAVLGIDDALIDASKTLDAGRLETFRRITLPLIAPGLVAGGILVFLTTMKELPVTLMLKPVGMDTLVYIIWEAQRTLHYSYAALPAFILILISGLTMLVLLRQEGPIS